MPTQSIDLIMPLYHPHPGWEESLIRNLTGLKPFLDEHGIVMNAYLVNDGSPESDYAPEALAAVKNAFPDFRFLSYSPNRGKGYCLRYGIERAQSEILLYTDADFPFGTEPLKEAFLLLSAGRADVVMGTRNSGYHAALTFRRKVISHAVRVMNRLLLFLPGRICDTQAGVKGFNAKGKRCFLATTADSFIFDTEFIFYSYRAGLRIEPIPVELQKNLHFAQVKLKTIVRETLSFGLIFVKSIFCGIPVKKDEEK